MVGHGLGMISRAGSDHSTPLFVITQQQDAIERAALFECSGALQVIQLEINLLTGYLGEGG